jgi:hypothetical protein
MSKIITVSKFARRCRLAKNVKIAFMSGSPWDDVNIASQRLSAGLRDEDG